MEKDTLFQGLTVEQWVQKTGLTKQAVRSRIKKGIPLNKSKQEAKLYQGLTVEQWSKQTGLSEPAVRYRIANGIPLTAPKQGTTLYQGLTVNQWMQKTGLSYNAVRERIINGVPIDTPIDIRLYEGKTIREWSEITGLTETALYRKIRKSKDKKNIFNKINKKSVFDDKDLSNDKTTDLPYRNLNIEDMPGEQWIDAFGFDSYYEVSNLGRVRSCDRILYCQNGRERFLKGRIRKQQECKMGNQIGLIVSLMVDGKTHGRSVGGLILNSFKQPPSVTAGTHHINGVSNDNRLENMRYEEKWDKVELEYNLGLRNREDGLDNLGLTVEQWSKQAGWSNSGVRNRIKKGIPLTEPKKGTTLYQGKTVKQWMQKTGLSELAVRNRIAKNIPLTKPHKESQLYQGLTIQQWSEQTGLTDSGVRSRIKKGIPLTEPKKDTTLYQGLTIEQWMQKTGLSEPTVRQRIKNGIPLTKPKKNLTAKPKNVF